MNYKIKTVAKPQAKNAHFKTPTYLSARVCLACERVFGRGVDSNKGLLPDEK